MIKVGDDVTCPRLGEGKYRVIGEDDRHYILDDGTPEGAQFYKKHCSHLSPTEFRARREQYRLERKTRADAIGRSKYNSK